MRRTLCAIVVAIAVGLGLAVAPSPAFAVEPPPGPVDPATLLPSQVTRAIGTGSPLGDTYLGTAAYLKQALNAQAAGAIAAPAAEGVPITGLSTLSRGAAGSALTGAFMAGWMITDGTLALYGATTGVEPMGPACTVFPEWSHGALKTFYPFSMPDCAITVVNANSDTSAGWTDISYAGTTVHYLKTVHNNGSPGYSSYCFTGTLAAGVSESAMELPTLDGGWSASVRYGQYGGCSGAVFYAYGQVDGTNIANPGRPASPAMRLKIGGTVVATMAQKSGNPSRALDCRATWPDGSVTTGTGGSYKETTGLPLHAVELACNGAFVSKPGHGPGLLPTGIEVGSTDTETGARTELADSEVPDFTESERKGLTPGTTTGGLVLQKVVGTTVSSCMTWAADCANWWADSDEGTSTTSPYRCLFNGEQVALVECGIYRHTFDTQTQTPTITDPVTGEEVDWSAKPSTGNSLDPSVGPGAGGSPADQCFATGWSDVANPIDWVLVPVKCALVWAFAPRAAKLGEFQSNMNTRWRASYPGQLAGSIAGISAALGTLGDGNCGGVVVAVPLPDSTGHVKTKDMAFLAACPGDFFAPWAPLFKSLISLAIVLIAAFGIRGQLDRFVNN